MGAVLSIFCFLHFLAATNDISAIHIRRQHSPLHATAGDIGDTSYLERRIWTHEADSALLLRRV
jgi:hypothetical protein